MMNFLLAICCASSISAAPAVGAQAPAQDGQSAIVNTIDGLIDTAVKTAVPITTTLAGGALNAVGLGQLSGIVTGIIPVATSAAGALAKAATPFVLKIGNQALNGAVGVIERTAPIVKRSLTEISSARTPQEALQVAQGQLQSVVQTSNFNTFDLDAQQQQDVMKLVSGMIDGVAQFGTPVVVTLSKGVLNALGLGALNGAIEGIIPGALTLVASIAKGVLPFALNIGGKALKGVIGTEQAKGPVIQKSFQALSVANTLDEAVGIVTTTLDTILKGIFIH